MFVRASSKESRIKLIAFLESEGFQCVNNHAHNRQRIIGSYLPLRVDPFNRTIDCMGNVTCAAAAAQSGVLISEDEFYERYGI